MSAREYTLSPLPPQTTHLGDLRCPRNAYDEGITLDPLIKKSHILSNPSFPTVAIYSLF
jgi:hypothetical protein